MRDPLRIHRILNKVETAWIAAPDMRLGQLLTVIGCDADHRDVWNLEDDRLEEQLDAWLKQHNLLNGWVS